MASVKTEAPATAPHSCIVDGKSTNVVDGLLLKVSGWYDNEWGYASRCVDLLQYIGKQL